VDTALTDEMLKTAYLVEENRTWSLRSAREFLRQDDGWEDRFVRCLYRPFDTRWLFYHPAMIERGRFDVMRHMLAGPNLALILPKRVEHVGSWQHAFVSAHVSDHVAVSLKTIDYHFPLYLYPDARKPDLFMVREVSGPRPNLSPKVVAALTEAYGKEPSPEAIFHYVYAVLYAPAYREKYAEFLRMDFPRVPFAADAKLFKKLAVLGARLSGLHRLTSAELDPPACRFQGDGDGHVGKGKTIGLRYEAAQRRLYINPTQFFAPVPESVWSYRVGGYQVCEKWLKDRQERRLALEDIRDYCRMVTAVGLTLNIQKEIDALYPEVEKKSVET
jgi:predicted helicase